MTLVEVLVAMAILTVVSLALLQAFVSSVNYNKDAKENREASIWHRPSWKVIKPINWRMFAVSSIMLTPLFL